jgi:amino acid transporter
VGAHGQTACGATQNVRRLVNSLTPAAPSFVAVFVGFGLRYVAGHGTTVNPLAPFFSQTAGIGTLMAGAAILALAFLGFDGNFTDAASAAKDVMLRAGGGALFTFFAAAYVAGSFASGITSQASVARILFAMGRDGQLPRSEFALIHPRLRTPYLSVIIVGVVGALGAILLPLDTVASVISFGALVAFSCVNASVISHYFVRGHERTAAGAVKYLVAPAIACSSRCGCGRACWRPRSWPDSSGSQSVW